MSDPDVVRCPWSCDVPEFFAYHDVEWGFPVSDDQRLFEKLSLELFQSGLSWRTILSKRDGFRAAFAEFDPAIVAAYSGADVERLLSDTSIVRHRGKIEAVVNNAGRALELRHEFGSFGAYVWGFEPDARELSFPQTSSTSPVSVAMSKDLKKRGWRFVGPTTVFAFMQAMGLVNDHAPQCDVRALVDEARAAFARPSKDAKPNP